MIRKFGLKNFKPFAETGMIPFAPITLIYGPNSGGKTSLVQSIRLLKQTLHPEGADVLIPRGRYVDLGSYHSLVHRHEVNRDLGFAVHYDYQRMRSATVVNRGPRDYERQIDMTFRHSSSGYADKTELCEIRYCLISPEETLLDVHMARKGMIYRQEPDDADVETEFSIKDAPSIESLAGYLSERDRRMFDNRGARLGREGIEYEGDQESRPTGIDQFRSLLTGVRISSRNGLPGRIQLGDHREERRKFFSTTYDVLSPLSIELISLFKNTSHLGPLRSHPARHYMSVSNVHDTVGQQGEFTPQILHQNDGIKDAVNRWFRSFEIPYTLEIQPLGNEVTGVIISLVLTDSRLNVPVAPSDVGFGIGQLLPVLVEGCISADKIICVEQPEIHLHPRLQAHLADFFIDTSIGSRSQRPNAAGTGNQWIVETHSETVVRRLQRRIREGTLSADDVSVLYVDPGEGGSRVTQLQMDDTGDFVDEWPGGFFDDGFKESIAGL
jgi:hypothetical protein